MVAKSAAVSAGAANAVDNTIGFAAVADAIAEAAEFDAAEVDTSVVGIRTIVLDRCGVNFCDAGKRAE
jgi:hypothetical protein